MFARFEEIQPFLRSAVVDADAGSAGGDLPARLPSSSRPCATPTCRAPPKARTACSLSAVQLARGAVSPTYSGDRMAQVREAMAQFQAAKAQLR